MFAYCERIGCGHSMPLAQALFAIRWGMDASTDLIRKRLRCSKCGRKGGVALKRPSWNARGYVKWPSLEEQFSPVVSSPVGDGSCRPNLDLQGSYCLSVR
jgi:hypothetical protein